MGPSQKFNAEENPCLSLVSAEYIVNIKNMYKKYVKE
jgi:hypothetical protein